MTGFKSDDTSLTGQTGDEQCREPERRSRADLKWTIFRRRPVTADVMCSMQIDTLTQASLSPEDVLAILRDNVRQNPYSFIDDPASELLMSTSVQDWQDEADLLPWAKLADAFNIYWNMNASRKDWQQVLTPESNQTVHDVCDFIAKHARIENVHPPTLFGRECVPAGIFFAVRDLLSRRGADVTNLAPSSELKSYAIKHADVFVNEISRLAPGQLPTMQLDHPSDRLLFPVLLSWISLMVSLAISPFFPFLWIPVLAIAICVFVALRCTAKMEPTDVQFGDLVTFRDLCYRLAPGIRT